MKYLIVQTEGSRKRQRIDQIIEKEHRIIKVMEEIKAELAGAKT